MSLYLGNTKITPMLPNNRPWWGVAKNPELLYSCTYTFGYNLTNININSTTTAAVTLLSPPNSPYSTASAANAIIDRWGNVDNGHNGESFNFLKYDYFVLADYLIDVQYTTTEGTMSSAHPLKYTQTSIMPAYRYFTFTNGVAVPGNGSGGNNNLATTYYGTSRLWYRKADNSTTAAAASYGFYLTPAAFTLSTSKITSEIQYINFRTPTLYFRINGSYMTTASFSQVSVTNTTFKMRQRLYRSERIDNYYEELVNRQAYMYINNGFPAEDNTSNDTFIS